VAAGADSNSRRGVGEAGVGMSRSRLALLLLLAAGSARASPWADLWATHDQQGQRLLDHKQPAAAAKVFDDERSRGYAELEAGNYAAAARLLEPYRDVDSQYNRGNALAYSGKLPEALAAYDAALAVAPGNADVIKNRDLVKRALDQQRQESQQQQHGSNSSSGNRSAQQQNGSSGGSSGHQGNSSNGSAGAGSQGTSRSGGGPDSANRQSLSSATGAQTSPSPAAPDSGSQKGQSQSTADTASGRGRIPAGSASNSGQAGGGKGAATAQPREAGSPNQTSTRGQQDAIQAKHQQLDGSQPGGPALPGQGKSDGSEQRARGSYGQTPLVQGNPGRAGQASQQDRNALRSEVMSTLQNPHTQAPDRPQHQLPQSEQALAMEQWLRTIPEDSGELLQRKFMIEHLMKQRGREP